MFISNNKWGFPYAFREIIRDNDTEIALIKLSQKYGSRVNVVCTYDGNGNKKQETVIEFGCPIVGIYKFSD